MLSHQTTEIFIKTIKNSDSMLLHKLFVIPKDDELIFVENCA